MRKCCFCAARELLKRKNEKAGGAVNRYNRDGQMTMVERGIDSSVVEVLSEVVRPIDSSHPPWLFGVRGEFK